MQTHFFLWLLAFTAILGTTGCDQKQVTQTPAQKAPEKAVLTLSASVDEVLETRTTTVVIKGLRATTGAFTQTALEFEPASCGPLTIAGATELELGKAKPVALSRAGEYKFENTTEPCIFKKMKIYTANTERVTATLTLLPLELK